MRRRAVPPGMKSYIDMASLIERVHYEYLCLVGKKLELVGATDLNSVQAVILLHIGDAKITINQMRTRGNYLGSNLSYIVSKLVQNGYLLHEPSAHDRRSFDIWLSIKGRALRDRLIDMHKSILPEPGSSRDLKRAVSTLLQIEQLWIDATIEAQRNHEFH